MKTSFIQILTNIYNQYDNKNKFYAKNCKYTIEQYFIEITNVLKSTHSWRKYNGLINGRTLNNKHNEFCKLEIYKIAYKQILNEYLKCNKLKKK